MTNKSHIAKTFTLAIICLMMVLSTIQVTAQIGVAQDPVILTPVKGDIIGDGGGLDIFTGPIKPITPPDVPDVEEEEEEEAGCEDCNLKPIILHTIVSTSSFCSNCYDVIFSSGPGATNIGSCTFVQQNWSFGHPFSGYGDDEFPYPVPTSTSIWYPEGTYTVCLEYVATAEDGSTCSAKTCIEVEANADNVGAGTGKQASLFNKVNISNYPNPFSNQTTLSYQLSHKATVSLKIVDIMGRSLSTPIAQQQQEAGQYRIPFEADDLATGFYFAILEVDDQQYVHKMLITK